MKKLILLIAIVASAFSVFAQDSLYVNKKDGSVGAYAISAIDTISFIRKHPTYVVINGVKWATCNVNTPGCFTTKAEDAGMFYQWNNKVGWPCTGEIGNITATDGSTSWNSSWDGGYTIPTSYDIWATANDPSPAGYHVPTYDQIAKLFNTSYVTSEWISQNGVYGRKFTDKTNGNSIFLPASGSRNSDDGILFNEGLSGSYWSKEVYYAESSLYFSEGGLSYARNYLNYGRSIRSVAENTSKTDTIYINKKDGNITPYAIADVDSLSFNRQHPTVSDYVTINGVRWAKYNVNTPGTFTSSPEICGYFYQWNTKVGWPSTGNIGAISATDGSTTWNNLWAGGYSPRSNTDKWMLENNPCPEGWRVPTYSEIQSLLDYTNVSRTWTIQNAIPGYKFTDIASGNSIFIPVSGLRSYDGSLVNGTHGFCWSNAAYDKCFIFCLSFYNGVASVDYADNPLALPIRPVVK